MDEKKGVSGRCKSCRDGDNERNVAKFGIRCTCKYVRIDVRVYMIVMHTVEVLYGKVK